MKEMQNLIEEQKMYWGQASDYIYRLYNTKHAAKYILNEMLESVARLTGMSQESRILEIGCAAGTQIIELADRGYRKVFGIDLSPDAIDLAMRNASERGVEITFITGDAMDMAMFKEGTFDVIFSAGVMEHIPNLKRALDEQYRILRTGGHIYVQVPNSWCPWYRTGKKFRSAVSRKQHFKMPPVFRTFSTLEMAKHLSKNSFLDIKSEIIGAVMPQCPDLLLPVNIAFEKAMIRLPILKNLQALACVSGRK